MPFRIKRVVYRCGKSFRTRVYHQKPKQEPGDKTGYYAAKAIGA